MISLHGPCCDGVSSRMGHLQSLATEHIILISLCPLYCRLSFKKPKSSLFTAAGCSSWTCAADMAVLVAVQPEARISNNIALQVDANVSVHSQ